MFGHLCWKMGGGFIFVSIVLSFSCIVSLLTNQVIYLCFWQTLLHHWQPVTVPKALELFSTTIQTIPALQHNLMTWENKEEVKYRYSVDILLIRECVHKQSKEPVIYLDMFINFDLFILIYKYFQPISTCKLLSLSFKRQAQPWKRTIRQRG